jgi:hypothetical protein
VLATTYRTVRYRNQQNQQAPSHDSFIHLVRNLTVLVSLSVCVRLLLKCDGTRAETRFRLSAKWTSPFKSAGASVQSTTGSRGVRISGSNARYTLLRGSVTDTGYPLHSPVSLSLPLPCLTVFHHISTGLYRGVISAEFKYEAQLMW